MVAFISNGFRFVFPNMTKLQAGSNWSRISRSPVFRGMAYLQNSYRRSTHRGKRCDSGKECIRVMCSHGVVDDDGTMLSTNLKHVFDKIEKFPDEVTQDAMNQMRPKNHEDLNEEACLSFNHLFLGGVLSAVCRSVCLSWRLAVYVQLPVVPSWYVGFVSFVSVWSLLVCTFLSFGHFYHEARTFLSFEHFQTVHKARTQSYIGMRDYLYEVAHNAKGYNKTDAFCHIHQRMCPVFDTNFTQFDGTSDSDADFCATSDSFALDSQIPTALDSQEVIDIDSQEPDVTANLSEIDNLAPHEQMADWFMFTLFDGGQQCTDFAAYGGKQRLSGKSSEGYYTFCSQLIQCRPKTFLTEITLIGTSGFAAKNIY